MSDIILSVEDLTMDFGGLRAVNMFHLKVKNGQVYGVIGPNGAGKTTFFNLITGLYYPTQGQILLNDKNIVGRKPHEINHLGIARTFQNLRLFSELTVRENILVGRLSGKKTTGISDEALLSISGLSGRADEKASSLPYGSQRKLEIVRALATAPRLLLLDEPAAGMNPQEVTDLVQLIRLIKNDFDLTIVLIEHQMKLVEAVCQQITVMSFGQVLSEGTVSEVQNDPEVIRAYLGDEGSD